MARSPLLVSLLVVLAACGGGDRAAPDAGGDRISLFFDFPEGSRCSAAVSTGVIAQDQIPGRITFPLAEQTAPVRCTLPSGQVLDVRAHKVVPRTAEGLVDIRVTPEGQADISMNINGRVVQMQPNGTVRPI